jgi:AraC-like DNA-binding protein
MSPAPLPSVQGGDEEIQRTPTYRFDNRNRADEDSLVVQRTLSGAGYFQDAGGRRLVASGYAMLFTHREESSYGYPPEAAEPYRLRYLALSAGAARPLFERLRTDFGPVVRMPSGGEAVRLFDELLARFRQRTFSDRFHQAELIFRLFLALTRTQVRGTRETDPVEFGYHQIRDGFRSPLNLKAVADACGVSREHFVRAFTRRYGTPPGAFLRGLRLAHARSMLEATRAGVEDVALGSGFASANSFCRAFRREFGRSPGQWREPTREDPQTTGSVSRTSRPSPRP